ncbi:MAG: ABC transporter ATP-binding protein [Lachnospiraceae bacterium]|nr:ABC transporter ATP-binding protein [Lachnospiraceae bacterium]
MGLKISGIGKKYTRNGKEFWAVKDIDIFAGEGSFINIIGRSGSGKTTLLNLIAGLLDPTEGEIFLDERKVTGLQDDERSNLRNKEISYITQGKSALKNLTVMQNVMLPCFLSERNRTEKEYSGSTFEEKQEEAQNLLERFGIGHLADSFPSGLSGGEIRRMSIARALINHPKILLADEPTGDLDPVNTELVLELFRNITKEKVTVISVTHENENPMYAADAVYKMDGGSLSLIRTGG